MTTGPYYVEYRDYRKAPAMLVSHDDLRQALDHYHKLGTFTLDGAYCELRNSAGLAIERKGSR